MELDALYFTAKHGSLDNILDGVTVGEIYYPIKDKLPIKNYLEIECLQYLQMNFVDVVSSIITFNFS